MSVESEACVCCQQNRERRNWSAGPWDDEPNRVEFEHAGLPCILHRGGSGAWCGYVGLSPGHRFHQTHYRELQDIDVHGGLTYSEECAGCICHVPKPGEPENLWWLGFDCAHSYDMRPAGSWAGDELLNAFADLFNRNRIGSDRGSHYWTAEEAREETKRLAEQLAS